jgi:hypothetical protein
VFSNDSIINFSYKDILQMGPDNNEMSLADGRAGGIGEDGGI